MHNPHPDPMASDHNQLTSPPTPLLELAPPPAPPTFRKRLLTYWHRLFTRSPDAHLLSHLGVLHAADDIPNQDAAFALLRPLRLSTPSLADTHPPATTATTIAAVFDGHGPSGHKVANRAADALESFLSSTLSSTLSTSSTTPELSLPDILSLSFKHVATTIDASPFAQASGTTASAVVLRDSHIAIAWLGDSSVAVISDPVRRNTTPRLRFVSRMHRPSDPDEKTRVLHTGAHIRDGYVLTPDANQGIAVTRTLGDVDMHRLGCISQPEVHSFPVRPHDAVVLLASDGLWDAPGITQQVVLDIAGRRRGRTAKRVCEELLNIAMDRGGPNDDCTIVCLTLR